MTCACWTCTGAGDDRDLRSRRSPARGRSRRTGVDRPDHAPGGREAGGPARRAEAVAGQQHHEEQRTGAERPRERSRRTPFTRSPMNTATPGPPATPASSAGPAGSSCRGPPLEDQLKRAGPRSTGRPRARAGARGSGRLPSPDHHAARWRPQIPRRIQADGSPGQGRSPPRRSPRRRSPATSRQPGRQPGSFSLPMSDGQVHVRQGWRRPPVIQPAARSQGSRPGATRGDANSGARNREPKARCTVVPGGRRTFGAMVVRRRCSPLVRKPTDARP